MSPHCLYFAVIDFAVETLNIVLVIPALKIIHMESTLVSYFADLYLKKLVYKDYLYSIRWGKYAFGSLADVAHLSPSSAFLSLRLLPFYAIEGSRVQNHSLDLNTFSKEKVSSLGSLINPNS